LSSNCPHPPIQLAQASVVVDIIIIGPYYDISIGPMNHDKLSAIEERLKAVEGNDLFDPIRVVKKCLVPKDFRVLDFIKYNRLECSNPNLWSYYNKMDEMIYNDKMFIYFFQDSLTRSILC
jgi:hypothetical protein